MYFVTIYTLLNVVSHYGSCSVHVSDGFPTKKWIGGGGGGVGVRELYPVFLECC